MRKPRCEDCRFFAAMDDDKGECRRKPPRPLGLNTMAVWPNTDVDQWCGDWRNVCGEPFYLWDIPEDVHKAVIDP